MGGPNFALVYVLLMRSVLNPIQFSLLLRVKTSIYFHRQFDSIFHADMYTQ